MLRYLRNHQDLVLTAWAVVFVIVIGVFFSWSLQIMVQGVNTSLSVGVPGDGGTPEVDIEGAKKLLEERGLLGVE